MIKVVKLAFRIRIGHTCNKTPLLEKEMQCNTHINLKYDTPQVSEVYVILSRLGDIVSLQIQIQEASAKKKIRNEELQVILQSGRYWG